MPCAKSMAVGLCLTTALILAGCGGGGASMASPAPSGPQSFQLSVQTAGNGAGSVSSTPTGIQCGSTCNANFSQGSQVTLTASASANSTFAGWGGACSGTGTCNVTVNNNMSVSAAFAKAGLPTLTVTLSGSGTVTSTPAGINCGSVCGASFPVGTQVTLTPTPASGFVFGGWGGACTGTGSCKVTLNSSASVSATFTMAALPTLTVSLSGTGTGTVTSTPAGINCGTVCAANFPTGTQVTLTQTPGAGSNFAGWGGACSGMGACVVTLNSSTSVSASFTQGPPMLTVTLPGTATGSVTSSPAGINCPSTCSATFASGTQVTLTETPGEPSTFSTFAGWGGACSGNSETCALTLVNNQQASATFNPAINHIIFAAQENRSFDHYFGYLRAYWAQNGYPDQSFDGLPQFNPTSGPPPLYGPPPTNPGCDPSSPPPGPCVFDPNNPITSFHFITQCEERPISSWDESHIDWDYYDPTGEKPAALNGYVFDAGRVARHQKFYDTDGIRAMGYYTDTDLNYYYFMASNFATSDRWFTPVMTRTNSNREFMVSGTSQGYVYPIGTDRNDQKLLTVPPIFEALENAGISWKIYVNPLNSKCTGPPYDPNCLLGLSSMWAFEWGHTIPTNYPNNIGVIDDYLNDLKNGTLPQVVEFEPATDAGWDEHPTDFDRAPSDVQRGANYIATQIVGPLMASQYWKDSVYIQTYDEFGGFYDHVPPQPTVSPDGIKPVDLEPGDICTTTSGPTCDFVYTGYRAPLLVISPYTKKNYVSHTVMDTTAILNLIEMRFDIPSLTARDAAQLPMTEFFDFENPPWMTPPTPPTQSLSGPCYVNKLP